MTKQYVRYICNHIIFTVIIWLCVFTSNAIAINVNEYGVYDGGGGYALWTNTTKTAEVSASVTTNWVYRYYPGYGHVISNWMHHNNEIFTNIDSFEAITANYGDRGALHASGTSNYIVTHLTPYAIVQPEYSCNLAYWDIDSESCIYHFYKPGTDIFTISGTTCGISDVSLYVNNLLINFKSTNMSIDTYSFDIVNQTNYKLVFSDTHEYSFLCDDNEVYNRDLCDYQILHYVDDCANLFKNPIINIIKNDNYANPLIEDGTSPTDIFLIPDDVILNDKLDIWIGTDQGEQFRTVYVENSADYIYHSYKSWNLDITVYDINTSAYIPNAKVSVNQDCRINNYPIHTYGITNMYGYVQTYDLSNQPYRVKVTKEGYNIFGYTTINAGFDAQHTNIPLSIYLQDSTKGSGNGSIGDPPNGGTGGGDDTVLPQTECSILWANNDSKSITEINNTVGARLYFMASNCTTTLYIESRNINTHTWDIETTLGLSALQTGYAQVVPSDWIYPDTKRYRGRLYAYDCGCDVSDNLKVWNIHDPNISIIVNLSSNVMFRHKIGGSYINPSSPIHILSSASSNNTTLLNINLYLFNESVKVDEISYTFFDYYDGGSFNPIKWKPNYEFVAGYRYSVYMYSNDILVDFDTVFANATGDNPFNTGNALTVKVYDHNFLPLQYSTVYVESFGSIDTGSVNKVTFNGLGDDTYEYRAIKSGYLDRGFDSVTLSADATVSYILDIIDTEHAVRDIRMADTDIKAMLYPIVFFILIMLLIGVLIDAVN